MLGVPSILALMASFSAFWIPIYMRGQEQVPCLAVTIAVIPSEHRGSHAAHGDLAALAGMPGTAARLMPLPRRHYWPCDLAFHPNWQMDTGALS